MIILAAFFAIFIGMAVGLLGGGGSILTTPLLIYVVGFDAKQAITASLFVVAVTSVFGLISHARAGRVKWRTGLIFGAAGMVGAFIGGQVGSLLPSVVLLIAFALMMGVTAVAMIRGRRQVESHHHGGSGLPLFRIILDGFIVGIVTGLVGAGGGFLVVPALVLLGGLAMPNAVATSLLVVAMKSFAGFFGYLLKFGDGSFVSLNPETQINWGVTLLVTFMAVLGALVGSRLVGRIPPDLLRKGFGWFVFVMAIFILSQEVGGAAIEWASQGVGYAAIEVVALIVIIALIVYIIRRPMKESVVEIADFDEPIPDDNSSTRKPQT